MSQYRLRSDGVIAKWFGKIQQNTNSVTGLDYTRICIRIHIHMRTRAHTPHTRRNIHNSLTFLSCTFSGICLDDPLFLRLSTTLCLKSPFRYHINHIKTENFQLNAYFIAISDGSTTLSCLVFRVSFIFLFSLVSETKPISKIPYITRLCARYKRCKNERLSFGLPKICNLQCRRTPFVIARTMHAH